MSTAFDHTALEVPPGAGFRLRLNETDLAIRSVDRALRGFGFSGFETQALVWLDGRLDAARLRTSLARLGRRHPIVTSRLHEIEGESRRSWVGGDGECLLHETTLADSGERAVLDEAGRMLSVPRDPREYDPIRFHVLHAPDGRDVFLMQYNHTLLDNNAALLLLSEIDRPPAGDDGQVRQDGQALIRAYLKRHPREKRREALQRGILTWGQSTRGGAVMLGKAADVPARTGELRIVARSLSEAASDGLRDWTVGACGFPSLSMAVLGSAFRALDRLAPRERGPRAKFLAGIGLDLGLRGKNGPIFQNLMSLVPIHARAEELADRTALAQRLSGQLREHLAQGIDLGVLLMTALFNRRPRYSESFVEHGLRHSYSLWYAYFGALDRLGTEFCGARIDNVFYTGPSWSPIGLTLLVNQYRGKLQLQATCALASVSQDLAEEFLQLVAEDLEGSGMPGHGQV